MTIDSTHEVTAERHGRFELTAEQSEALVVAVDRGYFDVRPSSSAFPIVSDSAITRATPLGRFADQEGEFGDIGGTLVAYYVYFLTIVTAANILQIGVLSQLLSRFAGYLPTLIGGLVVLIAGILIADFVGDLVSDTDGQWIIDVFGLAVKVLVYYMTATLTLNPIGFATDVLTNLFNVFVVALFGSFGLAVAIGLGFGTREYIAENIDNWTPQASDTVSEEGSTSGSGSGSDD